MSRGWEMVLWLVGVAGLCGGITVSRAPSAAPASVALGTAGDSAVTQVPAESIAALATGVVEHDPFRLSRRPAAVPFRVEEARTTTPPPAVVVPSLVGIVGGPPWRAVLDGVPGHNGPVFASPGDSVNGMVVRAVGPDTVVVVARDSVVKLTVRRAWP